MELRNAVESFFIALSLTPIVSPRVLGVAIESQKTI